MLFPSNLRSSYIDDMFDDFFRDDFWRPMSPMNRPARPQGNLPEFRAMKTDIKEHDGGYELEMNLPGFAIEDVKAELKDGYLTVTASHTTENEVKNENEKYIRRERYAGHYQRSFYVGDDITQEDIKAAFKDGVLNISIPKKEPEPPVEEEAKYIEIQEG